MVIRIADRNRYCVDFARWEMTFYYQSPHTMDGTPVQTVGSLYIITGINIALFPTLAMEGPPVLAVGSLLTSDVSMSKY